MQNETVTLFDENAQITQHHMLKTYQHSLLKDGEQHYIKMITQSVDIIAKEVSFPFHPED